MKQQKESSEEEEERARSMSPEIWKPVIHQRINPGYEISNYGRMKNRHGRMLKISDHSRTRHFHPQGPNGTVDISVAQAVLAAFVSPRPEGAWARHIDGDFLNFHPSNLEWTDVHPKTWIVRRRLESLPQAEDLEEDRQPRGEAHGSAKLTADDVRNIRAYPTYRGSQRELAEKYGVSAALVSAIILRKVWKHI